MTIDRLADDASLPGIHEREDLVTEAVGAAYGARLAFDTGLHAQAVSFLAQFDRCVSALGQAYMVGGLEKVWAGGQP
ncbi:hypothetical protein [Nonomuraea endophytica]|uniref:hypothetical protein n=1 Tax=Nonomuraea endophytica TaxID=714136 RepID=UPI0037CAAD32